MIKISYDDVKIQMQDAIDNEIFCSECCDMKNSKTYYSFDLTTICTKILTGNQCEYCYVKNSRDKGFNAKKLHSRISYQHEILGFSEAKINKLNEMGGYRFFSFADYHTWMDADIKLAIEDAKKVGLKLKAITKQLEFVDKFHSDFNIIHISIDAIENGIDWETAKQYREMYPNVLIRSVVLEPEQIEELAEISDILTLNHGANSFHKFLPVEKAKYQAQYADKMCCTTGKCETCQIKCGESKVK
jgi:hypothetical protein